MNKVASMSPAIQNAQMEGGPSQSVDKEDIFKELFTDRAYKSFTSKFPFLVDFIRNFKVINSDQESGSAVGAFFVQVGESVDLYMVPVILKSNTLQPIMFIYDPAKDLFLPLDGEWFEEISKQNDASAGEVTKPDEAELLRNNNLMDLYHLPTGRGVSSTLQKLSSEELKKVDIPKVVSGLSNRGKKAFLDILNDNKKVASYYFDRHNVEDIKKSFQKKAEEVEIKTEKADILKADAHTPLDMVKKEFGQDHVVMDDIVTRGYHIKDNRDTNNKMVVFTEGLNTLENPTKSGAYELYLSTGQIASSFIIQDPTLIDAHSGDIPLPASNYHPGEEYKTYHVIAKNQALVLFPNGDYTIAKNDNMLSTPTLAETMSDSMVYKTIFGDKTHSIPVNKPFIFIKKTGNGYITTGPITVKTKVDEGDIIKCTTDYGENTIIYSSKYMGNTIYVTKDNTVIIPDSFKVLPLKNHLPCKMVIGSMKTIATLTNSRLIEHGGKPVTIVKDDKGCYGVETNRTLRKDKAIVKIARDYDVNAKEVESVLDEMDKIGSRIMSTYIISKGKQIKDVMTKEAQMPGQMMPPMGGAQMPGQPMPPMGGGMMPGQPPMDPSMMMGQPPMDPSMMMGQPPMDPSMMMGQGVDMAQQMGDDNLFDASALVGLSYTSELEDLFPKYLPNLITAMDNVGRILINFWINAEALEEELGVTEYGNLEVKLKTLHRNIADLLLSLKNKVDIFADS